MNIRMVDVLKPLCGKIEVEQVEVNGRPIIEVEQAQILYQTVKSYAGTAI